MLVDAEELPNLDLEGLDKEANVISYEEDHFIFRIGVPQQSSSDEGDFDTPSLNLEPDQLPAPDLLERLIDKTDISVFDPVNLPS